MAPPCRRRAPLLPALLLALPVAQRLEYKGAPLELGRDAPKVGQWIEDVAFQDVHGKASRLSAVMGEKGLVVALRDPDCPLSKRYSPRLMELEGELSGLGFGVLLVNVLSEESAPADVEAHGFRSAYAVDAGRELAAALAAQTTTEVFVLDRARTLVYRGMIDDQYGLGFEKPAPERRYLLDAVRAVAAGEPVRVPATQAQGCLLKLDAPGTAAGERPVTWHERVSRIVQSHCETCHRPGGAGPFPLTCCAEAVRKKGMIEWVLEDRRMPPWFAAPGSGPWANDTALSDAEREDVLAWIAAGCPEGDPVHAPLAKAWTPGWTIGEPDLVVPIPEPIRVPAEGVIDYRYVYAPTGLTEDRWVRAVEIHAGAPEVVHHVLVFVESPEVRERIKKGDREARRLFQDGVRGYFASMVPGQSGLVFPEGTAKLLPAGSWIKFQLHYTPDGTERTDRSEVGFVFADEPPRAEVRTTSAINTDFAIPPYAFDHEVRAEYRFPEDAELLSLFPHTHLRGSRFRFDLGLPDGSREELLVVPCYDFNWQLNYELLTPRRVPAGTRLFATAWYDNSKENPANPDPSAWVRFGEQTFEEMMIGYVNWVPAARPASGDARAGAGGARAGSEPGAGGR
jgi:mono/diheme cytochrome c family protein